MRGTFGDGLDKIKAAFGRGSLIGTVEVDQVYAHYQHDPNNNLHHPDGGGPNYLADPLFSNSDARMEKMATRMITEQGSEIEDGMIDAMEDLSEDVHERAPWEFGDLRESGHPVVTSDGETIYDRAPHQGRLSAAELKQKAKLSRKYDPDRYTTKGTKQHAPHMGPHVHGQVKARKRGE